MIPAIAVSLGPHSCRADTHTHLKSCDHHCVLFSLGFTASLFQAVLQPWLSVFMSRFMLLSCRELSPSFLTLLFSSWISEQLPFMAYYKYDVPLNMSRFVALLSLSSDTFLGSVVWGRGYEWYYSSSFHCPPA